MKFKYALKEIKRNLIFTILLIIQIIFVFFSLYNSLNMNTKISEQSESINTLFGDDYFCRMSFLDSVSGSISQYSADNKEDEEKLNKMVGILNNSSDYTFLLADVNRVYIKAFAGSTQFVQDRNTSLIDNQEFFAAKGLIINENYNSRYTFKIDSGRNFNGNDFIEEETIPILLGYNYNDFFKVGDEIEEGSSKIIRKLKVVGILEKDQYSLGKITSSEGKYILLDDRIIVTPNVYSSAKDTVFSILKPSNYLIFNSNISEQDINKRIKNLQDTSENITGIKLNIKDLNRFIRVEKQGFQKQQTIALISAGVIIFFIIVTLITSILDSINRRKYEFSIHIFSGGRMKDIAITVCIQIFITLLIGYILSLPLIMYFGTEKINIILYLKLFPAIIITSVLLSIIPIIKIMRINISTLIKGE